VQPVVISFVQISDSSKRISLECVVALEPALGAPTLQRIVDDDEHPDLEELLGLRAGNQGVVEDSDLARRQTSRGTSG
jgi:hypothetical protein